LAVLRPDAGGDVVGAEVARERADHGKVDAARRERGGPAAAAAARLEVAGVGGDRVSVDVARSRGSAEL